VHNAPKSDPGKAGSAPAREKKLQVDAAMLQVRLHAGSVQVRPLAEQISPALRQRVFYVRDD